MDLTVPALDEAPKDPGAQKSVPTFDEKDFEGHRVHNVFVGAHMPPERRHSHRRHKHHHRGSVSSSTDDDRPSTPPAQRVQFILGEDVDDGTHESHPLFSEMVELVREGEDLEWKETARWIKFEEDVEEGGNRWSKPHVATLSLHSLFELRSLLLNGTVVLDMEATTLEQVTDLLLDHMTNGGQLAAERRDRVRELLLKRYRHQHQCKKHVLPMIRSFADIGRNHSSSRSGCCGGGGNSNDDGDIYGKTTVNTAQNRKRPPQSEEKNTAASVKPKVNGSYMSLAVDDPSHAENGPGKTMEHGKFLTIPGQGTVLTTTTTDSLSKSNSSHSMSRNPSANDLSSAGSDHSAQPHNLSFMKKIPSGAEASNILVGEVDGIDKPLSAFVRLRTATIIGDLTEVPVPSRFIFLLLVPTASSTATNDMVSTNAGHQEIGRSMAVLMSDEIFHEVAYRARNRSHILAGVDEFLDAVTVLPPGEWDPAIRIEPPGSIPSQDPRKRPPSEKVVDDFNEELEEQRLREESGLSRSGRLFGGLINDFKRKAPFYWSDFKDGASLQCIASWVFLYFACLSPIITFGGLLSQVTGRNMAAMESLIAGFICGIVYGLFSGQPLTILGSTGPVLIFEAIVYEYCQYMEWDYLSFRLWIGIWVTLIIFVLVAIDASALVCYITRFTEENFACLIAFIFIIKAIENVISIGNEYPLNTSGSLNTSCFCITNGSIQMNHPEIVNWTTLNRTECLANDGLLVGPGCSTTGYVSDVYLMTILLFIGTFLLSIQLKEFKNALFFPSKVRQLVSDFSIIIVIIVMSLIDHKVGVPTPKLEVPHELKPTLPNRGWIVMPFVNPSHSIIVAILPALLATILIFMDQQITTVIINRKENKLKKGCGYHLDLFIIGILILICSIMGLPWFCAATVLSINHVNSLKIESECAAPGEKPQFLGVREQRFTHVMIFITIGFSVFLTPMLSHIPMPVLFGVFLYMGVASLKGIQFFDRMMIVFMPGKYQPDYMYLRKVPIKRVHLFTAIQLACLACLWSIKSFASTAILFPLMLVVMIGIRKALDLVFTQRELKILDDVMPEMTRRGQHQDNVEVGWAQRVLNGCLCRDSSGSGEKVGKVVGELVVRDEKGTGGKTITVAM